MSDGAAGGPGAPAEPAAEASDLDAAFLERFASMVPADVAKSFSDGQHAAIVAAFGARRWRRHAVDLRLLVPLFGHSYYFVLLAGGERRSAARRLRDRLLYPIATAGNAFVAFFFFAAILFSVLAVLYVLKSLLGINLLPGMSLGLMPIITEELKLLFR